MLVGVWLNLNSCSREPSVLCEPFCACSDCAAVLLIFNGKWLRFLSEPLELAARFSEESRPSETFRVWLASTGRGGGGRPRLGFFFLFSFFFYKVIRRPLLRKYSAEWIDGISERWKIIFLLNPFSSDVCEQSRYSRSVPDLSFLFCFVFSPPPGQRRKPSAGLFHADPGGAQAESDARSGRFFVDWTQNAMRHLLIFVNERDYRRRQQNQPRFSPSIMEEEED